MKRPAELEHRLQQKLLLARSVEGDRLMLADEVLRAALDGTRPLSKLEQVALQESPLTARRLGQLAHARRASANDAQWGGSVGMLRAAASDSALATLVTDDRHWSLHFVAQDGAWRVILQLAPDAPFAKALLRAEAPLRVRDGAGEIMLEGGLDADGECEAAWPFAAPPADHLQRYGARFAVEPVRR